MRFTESDFARGRRLLQALLPWARAEAGKKENRMHPASALGRATFGAIGPENLDALMIYRAPLGGWHADLLLRDMPPGVPNTLGTPVECPQPTREQAEAAGKAILVGALIQIAERDAAAPPPRAFLFYDWTYELRPEIFERIADVAPGLLDGLPGGEEAAIIRVEQFISDSFPAGYQGESPADWPLDLRQRFFVVAHGAALSGLFAYPVRQHGKPRAVA